MWALFRFGNIGVLLPVFLFLIIFLRRNIYQVAIIIPYIVYRKQNLKKSFKIITDVFQSFHLNITWTHSCEFEKRSKFVAPVIGKKRATLDNFTKIEGWNAYLLVSFSYFLLFFPVPSFLVCNSVLFC